MTEAGVREAGSKRQCGMKSSQWKKKEMAPMDSALQTHVDEKEETLSGNAGRSCHYENRVDLHGFRGGSPSKGKGNSNRKRRRGRRQRQGPIPHQRSSLPPIDGCVHRDGGFTGLTDGPAKPHPFGSPVRRGRQSNLFWCGTCDESMPWREKRAHFESDSHRAMRDVWFYCVCCDERMKVEHREQHTYTARHYELLPPHLKDKVVNRRCHHCRPLIGDHTFRTQGEWLRHCLSDEHRSSLMPRKPSILTLRHCCEICPGQPLFDSIVSWNGHCETEEHKALKKERETEMLRLRVINRTCSLCGSFHKIQGEWDEHVKGKKHRQKEIEHRAKKEAERKESEMNRKLALFCDLPMQLQKQSIIRRVDSVKRSSDVSSEEILEFIQRNWTLRQRFDFVNQVRDYSKDIGEIESMMKEVRFKQQWQFLDESGVFVNLDPACDRKMTLLKKGQSDGYSVGGQKYLIIKNGQDCGVQQNTQYQTMRHLRQVMLHYQDSSKRIIWKNNGVPCEWPLMCQLQSLPVGCEMNANGLVLHKTNVSSIRVSHKLGGSVMSSFKRHLVDPSGNDSGLDNRQLRSSDLAGATGLTKKKRNEPSKKGIADIVSGTRVRSLFAAGMPGARVKSLKKMNSAENRARLSMFLAKSHLHKQEKVVFHGTDPATVPKISKNGFNRDFNTAYAYGRGTYFGSTSNISHSYTRADLSGSRYMFVCLMGITHVQLGDRSIVKPPILSDGVTQVDTLVDNVANPTILVAMKDSNALPLWLIEYSVSNDSSYSRSSNPYYASAHSYSVPSSAMSTASSISATSVQSTSSLSTNATYSRPRAAPALSTTSVQSTSSLSTNATYSRPRAAPALSTTSVQSTSSLSTSATYSRPMVSAPPKQSKSSCLIQ